MQKRGVIGAARTSTAAVRKQCDIRMLAIGLSAFLLLGVGGQAYGFEVETGNADLGIRFDNTVRYGAGWRVQAQNPLVMNHPYRYGDDALFNRGDMVTNRIDLLSEFDVTYKKTSGVRISAAAWFDKAYADKDSVASHPIFAPVSSYHGNQLSAHTKRFYVGPSAEFLDAFVFTQVQLGDVPVNLKAGKHTIVWGESLFASYIGVNYGQSPLDLGKAVSSPGAEVKELFMPMKQISGQAQLTDNLSIAAYRGFQWTPDRIPEGGTYLADNNFMAQGPQQWALAPGLILPHAGKVGGRNGADWGVNLRWSPSWLDGTLGVYYRKFDEKMPWVQIKPNFSSYRLAYAQGTEIYGVSLAKNFAGVSVGAELAYRKNGSLASGPSTDDTESARGNVTFGLINGVAYFASSPLWNQASLAAELTWSHLNSVTKHPELFKGMGYVSCLNLNKWDGCATKDAYGASISFTPSWDQVLPSVDLSMPITFGIGVDGNGPTPGSSAQGNGNGSIALSALYANKHQFTLKYIGYLARSKDNGQVITGWNGGSLLTDRGWLSFTYKTAF